MLVVKMSLVNSERVRGYFTLIDAVRLRRIYFKGYPTRLLDYYQMTFQYNPSQLIQVLITNLKAMVNGKHFKNII